MFSPFKCVVDVKNFIYFENILLKNSFSMYSIKEIWWTQNWIVEKSTEKNNTAYRYLLNMRCLLLSLSLTL